MFVIPECQAHEEICANNTKLIRRKGHCGQSQVGK
ncbi:hypothetical protein BVRB_5g113150 [Beta vulgaris subsp. vulgaris]|nr:hypothetical protein BVRB_5g113150 [Beta vulgaris subsp. vulgaris]